AIGVVELEAPAPCVVTPEVVRRRDGGGRAAAELGAKLESLVAGDPELVRLVGCRVARHARQPAAVDQPRELGRQLTGLRVVEVDDGREPLQIRDAALVEAPQALLARRAGEIQPCRDRGRYDGGADVGRYSMRSHRPRASSSVLTDQR